MRRIAILGAGGMGTALALLFARSADEVRLWAREPSRARDLAERRENARHLPGARLPDVVSVTSDAGAAASGADLIVVAIPTQFLRPTLGPLAPVLPSGCPVLSVAKGIENATFARPSRVIVEALGLRSVAVLSGPSHAEELARGLPASVVVAGPDEPLNRAVRDELNRGVFRVYTNPDAVGVELAGALKNVLGIAAGVCDGLKLGDNAKAALLTRGLAEIARFGIEQGGSLATFYGLAGVGDVVTTCFSPFGRNRSVGERLGRGESLESILASMVDVAEGVPTTRSVHDQARVRGIDVPITSELHAIMFEGKPPGAALASLLERSPKEEGP